MVCKKKSSGGGGGGGGGVVISTLQKKHGRDYVHLYKNEQKGFRPGGILSVYGQNPSRTKSLLLFFYKVDKIPSVNFPTRTKPLPAEIPYVSPS